MAYDFVDGVVAADVFAGNEKLAGRIEEGGGVEAAGGVEGGLGGAEFLGELEEGFEGEFEAFAFFYGWELLVDGFDAGFAAEAATGSAEDVAGEAFEVERDFGGKENVEDIAGEVAFGAAGSDFDDVWAVF